MNNNGKKSFPTLAFVLTYEEREVKNHFMGNNNEIGPMQWKTMRRRGGDAKG